MNFDLMFTDNYTIKKNDLDELLNYFKKKEGWIYISKSKDNGFLKIGRTGKNPWSRAKTLSSSGVFSDYEVLFSLKVFNQFIVEKNIHRKLKKYRVIKTKEFFLINLDEAKKIISQEVEIEEKIMERFFNLSLLRSDMELIKNAFLI